MSKSAVLDFSFLDPFPFSRNDFVAQEVGVGGGDVVQVLVVTWLVAHDGLVTGRCRQRQFYRFRHVCLMVIPPKICGVQK